MSLAPWRSPLASALHRNRSLPYARYLQLATVRADGRPANRTVVFRGFRAGTNQLQIVTDDRSEKVGQLHDRPWAEICWYFPKTREQFRLSGQLHLVEAHTSDVLLASLRHQLWQGLSDAARGQFVWPHPGKARGSDAEFAAPADPVEPVPNFTLLLLEAEQVDHLELRGNPQNRTRYECRENGWTVEEVNP